MPAAALRPPEEDASASHAFTPGLASPLATSSVSAPDSAAHELEWRTVAPLVDRFTGARPAQESVTRRKVRKRHRAFSPFSGPVLATALIFCELMGLVWVYALDLSALRQEDALKKQMQQTSLQIALNQNKLASYKSSPLLTQWAAQLGYRPIEAGDFDDVTSNTPLLAPVAREVKP